jgi:hypothetical protein
MSTTSARSCRKKCTASRPPAPPRPPASSRFVPSLLPASPLTPQFHNYKLVYRRYAGLYFSFCIDYTDNELAYHEAIHLFVEILDRCFPRVSELHLVYSFAQVYLILDEVFLAGEIQETGTNVILKSVSVA